MCLFDLILLGTQLTCTNTKLKNIKIELQSEKKEILHNLAEQNIKDNKSTKDSPKSFNEKLNSIGILYMQDTKVDKNMTKLKGGTLLIKKQRQITMRPAQ